MSGMMTTNREEMLEGIALKLWWGWTPRWSSGIWSKPGGGFPGTKTTEKMTSEEREWFKSH